MDAIVLRGVAKDFKKQTIRREYTTFKSELVRFLRRQPRKELPASSINALTGIDFTVKKGETFGLVGRNGSGKSTLLKLITGIYSPTRGTLEVNGRISALLELGAGFHPEFSGRENILINGVILGMSRKEIRGRMDEIIAFSELGDFIDEPVRTYSSGMYMRLAFAVATHVDPEILIVDEILAVGDEQFAKKSKAKLMEFRRQGKTIVLVTHDLGTLQQWCDRAAWLDKGVLRSLGEPHEVVAEYRKSIREGEAAQEAAVVAQEAPIAHPRSGPPAQPDRRWGSFAAELRAVRVLDAAGNERAFASAAEPVRLAFEVEAAVASERLELELALVRADGLTLWTGTSPGFSLPAGGVTGLSLDLPRLSLGAGDVWINVTLRDGDGGCLDAQQEIHRLSIQTPAITGNLVELSHQWLMPPGVARDRSPLAEAS
jgi:lipopolysaccharide transport system ATP-binding protein